MYILAGKQAAGASSGARLTRKEFNVRVCSVYQIPEELRTSSSWVLWKKEHTDGKPTKVLYQVNGRAGPPPRILPPGQPLMAPCKPTRRTASLTA